MTPLDMLEQEMDRIHQESGGSLESGQMLDMLKKSDVYPPALGLVDEYFKTALKSSWPSLPYAVSEMVNTLSSVNDMFDAKVVLKHLLPRPASRQEITPAVQEKLDNVVKPAMVGLLGEKAKRPAFNEWLNNVATGQVALDAPISERFCKMDAQYQGLQYRGEHGDPALGVLKTKLDQLSFSTEEVAIAYATIPNERKDVVHTPRLIAAEITIVNPFVHDKDDPFVGMGQVRELFDTEQEWVEFSLSMSEHMSNTDNFGSVMEEYGIENTFDTEGALEELMALKGVDVLEEFYVDIYHVFDRKDIIDKLRAHGYDGLMHGGMGDSACEMEYKTLYPDQVSIQSVHQITESGLVLCPVYHAAAPALSLKVNNDEQRSPAGLRRSA